MTMQPNLDDTLALLERTPAAVGALLRGLPDPWVLGTEGNNTWSARDIVGHLIHCERTDWMVRARVILDSARKGSGVPQFPPFDRAGHKQAIEGKSLPGLLDEFAELRAQNLDELRSWRLGPAELEKSGRHPALGEVTLDELLATWSAHDLNHLHQMARVMAHQYRDAVGPFAAYLGVLHCDAHGS